MPAPLTVVEISAEDAHDLRRRVLREGTPSDEVRFEQDAWPATFHLGARDAAGALVGIATFFPSPTPCARTARPSSSAGWPWSARTRARASAASSSTRRWSVCGAPASRSCGRTPGTPPLPFYRRLGMEVVGEGFLTSDTKLPHHVVVRDL